MPPLITDAVLPYSVQRNYISIQLHLQDIGRGSFKCSIKILVTIWLLLFQSTGIASGLLAKGFFLPHTSKIPCNSQAGEDSHHFAWLLHFVFVVHRISIPGLHMSMIRPVPESDNYSPFPNPTPSVTKSPPLLESTAVALIELDSSLCYWIQRQPT